MYLLHERIFFFLTYLVFLCVRNDIHDIFFSLTVVVLKVKKLQFLQQNNVAVGGEVFVASLQVTLLCHLQVAAYAQLVHV